MMTVFLWILVAMFTVALVILVAPVRLHGYLQTAPRLAYGIDARLFDGNAPKVRLVDSSRPPKAKRKTKTKNAKSKKGRWSPNGPALLSALPDLIAGLLGAFEVEQLEMDVTFGLDDPSDTGTCFGALMPFQYGFGAVRRHVVIKPDFSQACFGGELETVVHITPVKIMAPLIQFAWAVLWARP